MLPHPSLRTGQADFPHPARQLMSARMPGLRLSLRGTRGWVVGDRYQEDQPTLSEPGIDGRESMVQSQHTSPHPKFKIQNSSSQFPHPFSSPSRNDPVFLTPASWFKHFSIYLPVLLAALSQPVSQLRSAPTIRPQLPPDSCHRPNLRLTTSLPRSSRWWRKLPLRWGALSGAGQIPRLRRENRIRSVHASLAIENNTLSVD